MSKKFLLIVVLTIMISAPMSAQEHKHVLTSNVLNFIIRTLSLEYETQISSKLAVAANFRYGSFEIEDWKTSWSGASIGVHYYPKGANGLTGIFIGPLLYTNIMTTNFKYTVYNSGYNWETKTDEVTGSIIGPMFEFGHRWDWGDFAFSPNIMVGYLFGKVESSLADEELNYGGVSYGLGLNLGMTF